MNYFGMIMLGLAVLLIVAVIALLCIVYFGTKPLTLNEMIAKSRSLRKVYNQYSADERNSRVGKQVLKSIHYLEKKIKAQEAFIFSK